jgi:hypothetical protein
MKSATKFLIIMSFTKTVSDPSVIGNVVVPVYLTSLPLYVIKCLSDGAIDVPGNLRRIVSKVLALMHEIAEQQPASARHER